MKRVTVAMSEGLAVALRAEAQRRGESVSAIARRALAEHLGTAPGGRRKLGFAALGSSGKNSVAQDMEELLAEYGFGEPFAS